jgi:hypothetical protein
MAEILSYIPITTEHAGTLASWMAVSVETPGFDIYQREALREQQFFEYLSSPNAVGYGAGDNGVLQAAIIGQGNRMGYFLVDPTLRFKALLIAMLSAAYWCVTVASEAGETSITWRQASSNTFLRAFNKYCVPRHLEIVGRDSVTGAEHFYEVSVDTDEVATQALSTIEGLR